MKMNHSLIEKMKEENNKTKEMARMPQPNKLPHLVIVKSDNKDYLNFLFDFLSVIQSQFHSLPSHLSVTV